MTTSLMAWVIALVLMTLSFTSSADKREDSRIAHKGYVVCINPNPLGCKAHPNNEWVEMSWKEYVKYSLKTVYNESYNVSINRLEKRPHPSRSVVIHFTVIWDEL